MKDAQLKRRAFMKAAGAGAVAAALPACVRFAARPQQYGRPNVLFLMTDMQHIRSLSLYGNRLIQTPNMDRIGREGVRFDNATCVTPYCSPSRASILTGVYPHTHGILGNVSNRGNQAPLDPAAFPSTETILHEHGFKLGHRGKWHLGDKGDFPCYETWAYASKAGKGYKDFLAEKLPAATFANHPSPASCNGRPVEMLPRVEKGYHEFHAIPNNGLARIATIGKSVIPPELLPETQITDQVLDLLDQHQSDNFMITASWSPPHDLWAIPEPYYSPVDRAKVELPGGLELPEWDRKGASKQLGEIMGEEGVREFVAIYLGMVKYIDDQLGRVLQKLDDLGLADNTLVIFTSDHGDMLGAHGVIGKSIFSIYDDLLRVPLMMRLPGRIEPGATVDQFVSFIDFMPTILDYLGLPIPEKIHGRSLRPLIEGKKVEWRDYAFCQRANSSRMLRTKRYKYTVKLKPFAATLYDLQNDPHEDHDLASDPTHAAALREMHQRLRQVMSTDGDPLHEALPTDPLA